MTESALSDLLDRARGPLGPRVAVDFGVPGGPLRELGEVLSRINGFFAFDAGLQVFRVGPDGLGPELSDWNSGERWKHAYGGLADDYFCFGQDVLGTQYAIHRGATVVSWDPENARATPVGESLEQWARWVFADPDERATALLAKAWQDEHGPLEPAQRLLPRRPFVLGGAVSFDNLLVKDAAEAMVIRGPIARGLHDLPPGATVRLSTGE
ncbi:SMI1/KNR4 family protein [Saccharothrix sp. S26]|uniref:SMI1/KNR4 family protein n=1 Tax=Saccharothrix sp. S26 TaxID=2907215 RepID=UPI001F47F230|nr:SMI1/KNR4 family protein [Saccharothrix sp. S26]MCE6997996.1 SMI1/KNR4 family protein [Saccharothrix sp. S26]